MAEITNATGSPVESIVVPEPGSARRKLQLFRNGITADSKKDAKDLIDGKKSTLLDGEVIIARYNGGKDGILAIKSKEDEIVYFDSAALSSALQSVSGGTGITVTEKDANNNQEISLNIIGETQEGKIVINDKTSGENVVEITGLTAANVTYDNDDDKVITGATTTSEAIKVLDAALDAANKANLAGAEVTGITSGVTVALQDGKTGYDKTTLASFTVESTDANLTVANKADATGITLDIKSVGGNYDNTKAVAERLSVTGDIDATDALAQRSYVDAKVDQALDSSSTSVGAGKYSKAEGETISVTDVAFTRDTNDKTSDKYYINIKTGKDQVYDIELDATDFVKDSFLSSSEIVTLYGGDVVRPTSDAKGKATNTTPTETDKTGDKYFEFEMTCKGDADVEAHKEYIYVKTSDILGDLVGLEGISFDGGDIKLDLADAAKTHDYVQLTLGTDADSQLGISVDTATVTKDTTEGSTTKGDWVSSDDATDAKAGLATAQNLKEVANDLQDQIDDINDKSIVGSSAISVTAAEKGETKVIGLVLDDSTAENATYTAGTEQKPMGQYVGNTSNALAITEDGLYLSNVWDCGTF